MSPITTHVLDTALGRPASGIQITLEKWSDDAENTGAYSWQALASGITNADGRIADLLSASTDVPPLEAGMYRMVFMTERYCKTQGFDTFYPYIPIVFAIDDPDQHYHVPLLLSPFGYSTYRGS